MENLSGRILFMNTYELTILLPEGEAKEKTRVLKLVDDFVKKVKGSVMKQESWGAKKLAYIIDKKTSAEYEHFVLSLPPEKQPELDKQLRLDEKIMRYLFVRV